MSKYQELAKLNVNEHTEKKNGLTYLSWAWAVDQLLRQDEGASWEYRWVENKPYVAVGDTLMVFCTVNAFGKSRTAQLPVMDYKNKAIFNPTSMDLNTAMQRCLAKAIALHGIGLYIYAGEDLPDDGNAATATAPTKPQFQSVAKDAWDECDEETKKFLQGLADQVRSVLDKDGGIPAMKFLEEQKLEPDEKVALWSRFDSKERAAMEPHKRKKAA